MARRGMTILELIVASVLLGTLLVVSLQMLSAAADQRVAGDQRQCAIVELGNVMERMAAQPWEKLTTAAFAGERLSASAGSQLPGAELKIEIFAPTDEPNAKRITATLRWQDRSGQFGAPLTISTWRYRLFD